MRGNAVGRRVTGNADVPRPTQRLAQAQLRRDKEQEPVSAGNRRGYHARILEKRAEDFSGDVVSRLLNTTLVSRWIRRCQRLAPWSVVGLGFIVTSLLLRGSYDDAYITLRYVRNLYLGRGVVYNVGEPSLSTTTPAFALALYLLKVIFKPLDLPVLAGVLSGFGALLAALSVWWLARDEGSSLAGWIAAILWLLSPLVTMAYGGEGPFLAGLIALAILLSSRRRYISACIVAGVAGLTRGEGLLLIGVLLYKLWRQRQGWKPMLAVSLGSLVPWIPWTIYAYRAFGALLPATLGAKVAQGQSGLWPLFLPGAWEWLKGLTVGRSIYVGLPSSSVRLVLLVLAIAGVYAPRLRKTGGKWASAWVLWAVAFAGGYSLLGVPFYHWYLVPLGMLVSIFAGSGVEGALATLQALWIRGRSRRIVAGAMAGVGSLALLSVVIVDARLIVEMAQAHPRPVERLYTLAGRWLAENTPPDATVGYFEIGFLGYYSDRTIVDPVGLLDPEVQKAVARADLTWAYFQRHPDYILHNTAIFVEHIGKITSEPWFPEAYRQIHSFTVDGYPGTLILYELYNEDAYPPAVP